MRYYFLFLVYGFFIITPAKVGTQTPFACDGQVYAVKFQTGELFQLSVDGSNNSVRVNPLFNTGIFLDPLALRPTDNLMYGLNPVTHELYRLDASGQVEKLADIDVPDNLDFLAGGVSNDGLYFYVVGSTNGSDQGLYQINLENYTAQQILALGGQTRITDLAMDPYDDLLYVSEAIQNGIARIELATGRVEVVNILEPNDRLQGIYFNAFGDLFGYGTTAGGVASALFRLSKTDLDYDRIANGPVDDIVDLASCPYTVALQNEVNPLTTLPCGELTYTFTIANAANQNFTDIDFMLNLPDGVTFIDLEKAPVSGNLRSSNGDSFIRIENMTIIQGVSSFAARIYVDDVAAQFYRSQAELLGFPDNFGEIKLSDNPLTATFPDSTRFQVNRIDAEIIDFSLILCEGSSVTLDASQFGGNINWNTGSAGAYLTVQNPGTYGFIADSGCVDLEVTYDVVGASCPYVIELNHIIEPAEAFPCSEVVFRYLLENDSGFDRENITIMDSINPEFQFIELLTELKSGTLMTNLPDNRFLIDGYNLKLGYDTIDFLVYTGDISPGLYPNRSEMRGFHPELGVVRFSDDPRTNLLDSTIFEIKGTRSDTTYIDVDICSNEVLALNGSSYGSELLWENGSTDSLYYVTEPGFVELLVFDGCEDAHVFFMIEPALDIIIARPEREFEVHLGDSIAIAADIYNEGQMLNFEWLDPRDTSLRCPECLETFVRPFEDTDYLFYAENESCSDSIIFTVKVDKTRRVYFPNIFSASAVGVNNTFFFQSPDYGKIISVSVVDRWGGLRYYSEDMIMNDPDTGWRPYEDGSNLPNGVYNYVVEIEFIDRVVETFAGTITLID